jgi:hypothetical protein
LHGCCVPLQITRGGDEPVVATVPNQSAWLPTIDRLLDEYRRIGLHSAELHELQTLEIDPRLALAVVGWRRLDSAVASAMSLRPPTRSSTWETACRSLP